MLKYVREYFMAKQAQDSELVGFVFGADEQSLKEMIGKFASYYMFVDYGAFDSSLDSENRRRDTFEVAVTIAMPIGARMSPPAEVENFQIVCFEKIAQLRKDLLLEQKEIPWLKHIDDSHQILPFIAPNICRSVGSTLSFSISGYDLLNTKGS